MKKQISTIAAILIVNVFYGQWTEQFYVDDFGEKTNQSYNYIIAKGTFSNSATQNSKLTCKLIDSDSSLMINVYEYGSKLATSIESTNEIVKIKQPSGDIIAIKAAFFYKKGYLVFSEKKYTELMNSIKEKGNYIMIFSRTGTYSSSDYKINFTI